MKIIICINSDLSYKLQESTNNSRKRPKLLWFQYKIRKIRNINRVLENLPKWRPRSTFEDESEQKGQLPLPHHEHKHTSRDNKYYSSLGWPAQAVKSGDVIILFPCLGQQRLAYSPSATAAKTKKNRHFPLPIITAPRCWWREEKNYYSPLPPHSPVMMKRRIINSPTTASSGWATCHTTAARGKRCLPRFPVATEDEWKNW